MIYMLLDDFLKCNKNITKKRILIYIIITWGKYYKKKLQ